jgi:hypothetical protein
LNDYEPCADDFIAIQVFKKENYENFPNISVINRRMGSGGSWLGFAPGPGDNYKSCEKHMGSFFPIVRFYSKFGLFLSSSFSFGIGKGNTKYPTSISRTITYASFDSESKLWSANFGLGYAIKAGKSFLIEPQISYNYMNKTTTNNLNNTIQYSLFPSNTNTTNSNIFLGFGITYRF